MKRIVKSLFVFVVGLVALVSFTKVSAKTPAKVYFFYGDGCQYCAGAEKFFTNIEDQYGEMFDLVKYEVWNNTDNQALLEEVSAVYGDELGGVPYIAIGKKTFKGYALDGSFDESIIEAIKTEYEASEKYDVMEKLGTKVKNSNTLLYVVLAIVVLLEAGLLVFAKRNAYADETVKTETKKEEVKEVKKEEKPVVKKTPAKKATKKEAPKAEVKKTTTKKATTKKATTKKTSTTKKTTTTKKPAAKKATTKKTTKK